MLGFATALASPATVLLHRPVASSVRRAGPPLANRLQPPAKAGPSTTRSLRARSGRDDRVIVCIYHTCWRAEIDNQCCGADVDARLCRSDSRVRLQAHQLRLFGREKQSPHHQLPNLIRFPPRLHDSLVGVTVRAQQQVAEFVGHDATQNNRELELGVVTLARRSTRYS